jgi:hypothetical protein
MEGRDCVQEHCVACTRCHSSLHTIQCFHGVMEKFQKQRRFSLYSGNSAKFTVGTTADHGGGWGGWGGRRGERVMTCG